MTLFFQPKQAAGIEITSDRILSAVRLKNGKIFSIQDTGSVNIPADAVKPGFKNDNICQPDLFQKCLEQVRTSLPVKKIHVALPDACAKVFIRQFAELPQKPDQIREMVLWGVAGRYGLAGEDVRITWKHFGKNAAGRHVFLVVMGMESVISRYEACLQRAGITPVSMAPAGIARFNFYSQNLPGTGIVAYLSLFDDGVVLFVFSEGLPLFYRMVPKNLVNKDSTSAIQDVDLLLQYYHGEFADHDIDQCFIASYIQSDTRISSLFNGSLPGEITLMDSSALVAEKNRPGDKETEDQRDQRDQEDQEDQEGHGDHGEQEGQALAFYTAALGAVGQ